jgi:virginiamycin B lyase
VSEQIFKFDPVENKIVLAIPASFSGTEGSVGVGAGSIWVTTRGNVLSRFGAATGALEASIPLPGGAGALAAIFDNGFVWVTGLARDELYKIDPRTNTLV